MQSNYNAADTGDGKPRLVATRTEVGYASTSIELRYQDLLGRPDPHRHEVVALIAGREVASRRGESKDATIAFVLCDAKLFVEEQGKISQPLYLPLSLAQPGRKAYEAIQRIIAVEGGNEETIRQLRRWWELNLAESTPDCGILPETLMAEVAAHFELESVRVLIDGNDEAARNARIVAAYLLMRYLKLNSHRVASLLERSTANVGTNLRARCEASDRLLGVAEEVWAGIRMHQGADNGYGEQGMV